LNRVQLSASLASISDLRYTPAGVAVLEVNLAYFGEVVEAGQLRQLDFELDAVALGEVAERLARVGLGSRLGVTGFFAPRRKRSRRWVVHINEFVQE
jgi:primosomal replication protein N